MPNNERWKMKPKDQKIIQALLATCNQQEAARVSGVSVATIRRRLEKKEFMEAYDQVRREAYKLAMARIQKLTDEAAKLIEEVLKSDEPASTRLSAARLVLEYATKWTELSDIEDRLSELEQALEDRK